MLKVLTPGAERLALMQAKQLAELFLKPGVRVTRSMARAARSGTAGTSTDDMGYASSDDGGGDFGAHHAEFGSSEPEAYLAAAVTRAVLSALCIAAAGNAVSPCAIGESEGF
jgi:hypothetical protein